jgi:LacI family transcriptional regulator
VPDGTRPRPPTIRDVAARAQVSLGTASNALSGRAVSAEARAAVEEAARVLGWRANPLARGLRGARSGVLGLVLPSIASAFHAGFAEALEDSAEARGLLLMQASARGDPAQEKARIEALLDRRVDGLVLLPSSAPEAGLAALTASGTATVLVNVPKADPRFDTISLDEAGAMRAALAHLAARGHRRVLFLARYPKLAVTAARIAALKRHRRIATDVLAVGADHALFDGELPRRLRARARPTALIASNSILALWALRVLRREAMAMPGDIALLSFDAADWTDLTDPPLTVLRQPVAAMADAAAELLTSRLAQPGLPPRHRLLRMDLLPGGST